MVAQIFRSPECSYETGELARFSILAFIDSYTTTLSLLVTRCISTHVVSLTAYGSELPSSIILRIYMQIVSDCCSRISFLI